MFEFHVNALRTDNDARLYSDLQIDRVIQICDVLEPVSTCERGGLVTELFIGLEAPAPGDLALGPPAIK